MAKAQRIAKRDYRLNSESLQQFAAESSGSRRWLALGVFFLTLLIYLLTLYPTVPGGDSGEFIAAAYTLGIAHPPGYPLFMLLGKIFTSIPVANVAWRMNFLTALLGAFAAVSLSLAATWWARNIWAGLVAGGLFAFSPLVWRYSIQTEVFALNNLLIGILLFLAVRYAQTLNVRLALLASFVLGLGLSNQQTIVFYGVVLVVWAVSMNPRLLVNKRTTGLLLCFFGLGLLPYLYLPIASAMNPVILWGDASTLGGFLANILRNEYGTFQLGNTQSQFFLGLFDYCRDLPGQVAFVGVPLGAFGAYVTWKERRLGGLGRAVVIAFAFYLVVFHYLASLPLDDPMKYALIERFWQQANLIVCLWIGLGAVFLAEMLKTKKQILPLFGAVLVLAQIGINYRAEDQHRNFLFRDFAKSVLSALPQEALLLTQGDDTTNTVRYLQQCENFRRDVVVLDRNLIKRPWMSQSCRIHYPDVTLPGLCYVPDGNPPYYGLKELFDSNFDKFPIFVTGFSPRDDSSWEKNYETWPWGLLDRVVRAGDSFDIGAYLKESGAAPPTDMARWASYRPQDPWEAEVLLQYRSIDLRRSTRLLTYAIEHGESPSALHASKALLTDLIHRYPGTPPSVYYRNLGIIEFHLLKSDPSARLEMVQAWKKYLEAGPLGDDRDIDTIRKVVGQAP